MRISHHVHTGNGTHALYLDRELRDFTGIHPGTRVRVAQVDSDTFTMSVVPHSHTAITDPVMRDNYRIGISSTPETEVIFGQLTGNLTLDAANSGYLVFSAAGPKVFTEKGAAFVSERGNFLQEVKRLGLI